ncbi:hypothetical protein JCM3770_007256 [Rhodotorula araucariae]
MYPSPHEQKLAGFQGPQHHRRRVSLPTTPPETPMGGYFPASARAPPPPPPPGAHTVVSIYPASPPATPVRATAASGYEGLGEREKKATGRASASAPVASASGGEHRQHRRAPSHAYAHHRRTSTATILRLALAGHAPAAVRGMVLTPSKAVTLFLIALSAGYLVSFVIPPFSGARRAVPHPPHFQKPAGFALPTLPVYSRAPASRPVGDVVSQRKAWEEALSDRIPTRQRPSVPIDAGAGAAPPTSLDGELWRLHPELLGSGARPVRRRPQRLESEGEAGIMSTEEDGDPPTAQDDHSDRGAAHDSFDPAPAPAPGRPRRVSEAERMHAVAAGERQAQLSRMKKVAVAQRQQARVGTHVPIDSSQQIAAARAEQERVIVAEAATRKKKLRSPGRGLQELEEDVRAGAERERELTRTARRPHARVQGPGGAPQDREE